jgi:hypothetical protein
MSIEDREIMRLQEVQLMKMFARSRIVAHIMDECDRQVNVDRLCIDRIKAVKIVQERKNMKHCGSWRDIEIWYFAK